MGLPLRRIAVVSSGGTIYGKAKSLPITEKHSTNPISPYGITKLAVEKYALMFGNHHDLPIVILRPANAFGEGQAPFTGQGFIATAMASIIKNKEVVLFGESGMIRDYIHASEIAAAIVASIEKGKPGVCYNIGSGVGRSNKEVLDHIYPLALASGFKPVLKVLPARKFDVPANVLDSSKLTHDTGWEPVLPFKKGIERAWDWYCRGQAWTIGDSLSSSRLENGSRNSVKP